MMATSLKIEEEKKSSQMQMTNLSDLELVHQWLSDVVKLPEYFGLFIDQGYVSMDSIMNMNEDNLENMGVKKGHRKKILKYLLQEQTDNEEVLCGDGIHVQRNPIMAKILKHEAILSMQEDSVEIESEELLEEEKKKPISDDLDYAEQEVCYIYPSQSQVPG